MAASREAMLRELADLEEMERLLAEEQQLKQQKAIQESNITPTDIAQSFNTGLVDLVNFPSELANIPLSALGLPTIDTEGFREQVAKTGLTAKPGEEAEGILPRSARILGASVVPAGAIQQAGARTIGTSFIAESGKSQAKKVAARVQAVPQTQRTVGQNIAASAATSPLTTAALDVGGSLGAGFGGEVASELSGGDPTVTLLGELAGGFTVPFTTVLTRFAAGRTGDAIKATVTPFTKAGAEPRAARRVQSLSADPQADAARIDVDSPVSPARQTGNPNLIALENTVLAARPELQAEFTEGLAQSISQLRQTAASFDSAFGAARIRDLLDGGEEYLVNLANTRAQVAAQRAQNRIADLDAVNPRDVSRIAREELETALSEVRATERKLWDGVGKKQPATLENAQASLNAMLSGESKLVPSDIPQWLKNALKVKDKPTKIVDRFGRIVVPDESAAAVTLNDVQQIRSKVLEQARKATKEGDFNEARMLNNVADGLLADMSAVQAEGVSTAIAFSRALNQTYNQGAVADILSPGARRGAGVASEDTLFKLTSGANAKTNIEEFLQAAPQAEGQVRQFLQARFVEKISSTGKITAQRAQNELNRLERSGVLDAVPGLRDELAESVSLLQRSEGLGERAATVAQRGGARLSQTEQRSLSKLLAGDNPVDTLLDVDNAPQVARRLRLRMGNNTEAQTGLKSTFIQTLMNRASKDGNINGEALSQLVREHTDTATALGFNSGDLNRLRLVASRVAQAQQSAGTAGTRILDDKPSAILNMVVRIAGAAAGRKLNTGTIQAPAFVSSEAQTGLQRLTVDKAEQMLVDAMSDPVLFKALLTKTSATQQAQSRASQIIESWLTGAGVVAISEGQERDLSPGQGDVPPLRD